MLEVILSCDTEFNISGAFSDPKKKPLSHECFRSLNNQQEIGFDDVISVLTNYRVKATFFVEVLQNHYFPMVPMAQFVEELIASGQDVQMHAHPCWQVFADKYWQTKISKTPVDDFNSSSLREVIETLNYGLSVFESWGVPKPKAYRAGNLVANVNLYKALAVCGFHLSSNLGLGYFMPSERELQIENCVSRVRGIWEIPVTTFLSVGRRHKLLTVTGCSIKEISAVLKQCLQKEIKYVVILTHIHEFIKRGHNNYISKINRINLSRLAKICQLVTESQQMKFTCFGDLEASKLEPTSSCTSIKTNFIDGVLTIVENQLNDRIWIL